MSGWLLIIFLLLLGGLISSFGDLLGTKIGKARFSIFKLRPRKTATLITIITGSLISASSISFILLVNSQLRLGLFRLGDLQTKLQESRQLLLSLKSERETLEERIIKKERELTKLERNIIALRSGKVVIRSGQSIFIAEIGKDRRFKIDLQMQNIINNANRVTQEQVIPKVKEPRKILLLRKNHIDELKKTIRNGGDWVINIKSVRNVLEGENYVYAFPELIENKTIVLKDEIISKTPYLNAQKNINDLRNTINLLLASSLAEAKRRGSLINEIKLKSDSVKKLQVFIEKNRGFDFEFEVVSLRDSKTAQPIIVEFKVSKLLS